MDPNEVIRGWNLDKNSDTLRMQDPNEIIRGWNLPAEAPTGVASLGEPPKLDYKNTSYTTMDLTDDEFYAPIESYMTQRFGTHVTFEKDRDEVVEQYLNNMRGFSGGNAVRAINEMSYLAGVEEKDLAIPGEAYAIFENLPNIFSEEASWGDTVGGSLDYARSAVLDPANLIGGVIGKSVTSAGFKGGAVAANIAARKAFEKVLTRQAAAGATSVVADKAATTAATRVFQGAGARLSAQQTAIATARQTAALEASSSISKRLFAGQSLKEAGAMAAFDSLAAGATDYAYQSALTRTDVQDDISLSQTALTAGATLVLGGAVWSMQGLFKRQGAELGPEFADLKATRSGANLSGVGAQMGDAVKQGRTSEAGNWIEDVASGKELNDLDVSFWTTMVNGDEGLGIRGLKEILVDQNYVFVPRDDADNITNFLGDIIKEADPQDFGKFISDFRDASGNPLSQLGELTQDEFANTFKKKISDSGRMTNLMKQASDALGMEKSNLSSEDMWNHLMGESHGKFQTAVEGLVGKSIPMAQNQLIRSLVSNLSTTQLNLLGWSAASAMDSATDVVTAALQAPVAFARGDAAGVKQAGILAKSAVRKIANTLDPNTTYDQYLKYARARPKALNQLTSIMPGGVENANKFYQELDLDRSVASMRVDQFIDFTQQLSLVKAQDGYTKSIEFMSEMDKLLRMPKEKGGFGMSYEEFMAQKDYWKFMNTKEFKVVEQKAVSTALDNTFSRSYGNMGGAMGDVADFIEKSRNIPGVGMLVPFGRFFNNTMAFMSDYSGVSLVGRNLGLNKKSTESTNRLAARTAVGWGLTSSLIAREMDFVEKGLSWDEQTHLGDATGAISSEKYNFPYAFFKGAARIFALKMMGKEVPTSTVTDWMSTVGPESFTREFTDSFGGFDKSVMELINEDGVGMDMAAEAMGKIIGRSASSATRFLEPVNTLAGLAQGGDRIVADRRQGNLVVNEATRYMDNLLGLTEGQEQRYSATRGPLRSQDSKFLAPVRETKTTNMSRLASTVGINEWDKSITMIGKDAPEASNRYARLYNEINEEAAGRLLNDPDFTGENLEVKTIMVKELLKNNKQTVKDYMEAGVYGNDEFLLRVSRIQNGSNDTDISRALADLRLEKDDLMDLTEQELILLESALKFRDELLTIRN